MLLNNFTAIVMDNRKKVDVDIFSKENELDNLGFIFTLKHILYLLIVMWVFKCSPRKNDYGVCNGF